MAHVGVERLGPGHGEHDGAERHESLPAGVPEQAERVARIERGEHGRVLHDLGEAEQPEGREPDQHHRAEQRPDAGRAAALDEEEAEQHEGRDRDDVGLERGRGGFEAFDRGEDRDRRRDQAVAIEQRQAGDREGGDEPAERRRPGHGARGEGSQREHPALAAIVGAQDEDDVLHGDDQDQRPEDERKHAQHGGLAQVQSPGVAEGLAHGVERAGADVAVDHAQRGERERAQVAMPVSRGARGFSGRRSPDRRWCRQ